MVRRIASQLFWNQQTVPGSGTLTSDPINIETADALALYLTAITGTTPNITFTYSLAPSLNGPFTTPQSPVTIGANKAAADVMDFAPEVGGAIKIVATNNGTGNVVITTYLVLQEAA